MSGADLSPKNLRKHVLNMAYSGQSVHVACAFSLIEILSTLWSDFVRYDSKNPLSPNRDHVIISKGHGVMAQYACFYELGWLERADLENYFKNGSKLRGLSEADIPGIEINGGSLGHGLPVAVGMAWAARFQKHDEKIYCIVGDGELNEGTMWESILFAAHHKLSNLCIIVDANDFQAMGRTQEVLNLGDLRKKFEAFDFKALETDGHDLNKLKSCLKDLNQETSRPQVLVAKTVKGKGISFMEANNIWHYTRINQETLAKALKELE